MQHTAEADKELGQTSSSKSKTEKADDESSNGSISDSDTENTAGHLSISRVSHPAFFICCLILVLVL